MKMATSKVSIRRWLTATLAILPIFGLLVGASAASRGTQAEATKKVERGRYLAQIMACQDCHTPKKMGPNGPEPDLSRALSGHPEGEPLPAPPRLPEGPWIATTSWDLTAWSGPWGISYPVNLTPDENTGLGIWTEEMFVKAMRTGRHMGASRPILPPMPWQSLAALDDADLTAVYAYLRSLPPIHNRVPEAVIADEPMTADAR
jgi:mono/diheme cytochrome c family protein